MNYLASEIRAKEYEIEQYNKRIRSQILSGASSEVTSPNAKVTPGTSMINPTQ
jgi:hypothetical protein